MSEMQVLRAAYARPSRQVLIDTVHRSDSYSRPATPPPATPARRHVFRPSAHYIARAKAAQRHHRLWRRLQMPCIVMGCVAAGFFVQALWLGITLTLLYGVIALLLRLKSSVSFGLAILSFAATVIVMVAQPATSLASNFAAYAFLLLTIGVIALTLEVRPQRRKKRRQGSIRGNQSSARKEPIM